MIYLSFSFTNPFSNRFSAVYEKTGKTWNPHKFWDFSICKTSSIIGFTFDFNTRQNYAGSGLEIELFGLSIEYRFYDSRHWDYTNNCWEEIND
jgi:hypothetical protein